LGNSLGRGGDADKVEIAKEFVVAHKLTLPLVDLDFDGGLPVSGRGECLRLLGGDCSVPVDELRHNTTQCLDTWAGNEKP
jgi:NAD-specific glutamate dehydrogenase